MSTKKKLAPEVDHLTPELEALIAQLSVEEIESGTVTRPAGAPMHVGQGNSADVKERPTNAVLEESLARLVKTARTTARFSLADLAERLGVSRSRVHQLEQSGANLQLETLQRLADALGYDVQIHFIPRRVDEPTLSAPVG